MAQKRKERLRELSRLSETGGQFHNLDIRAISDVHLNSSPGWLTLDYLRQLRRPPAGRARSVEKFWRATPVRLQSGLRPKFAPGELLGGRLKGNKPNNRSQLSAAGLESRPGIPQVYLPSHKYADPPFLIYPRFAITPPTHGEPETNEIRDISAI
ncbi:unnamed protein product, partial [Iphiclides podalirius]